MTVLAHDLTNLLRLELDEEALASQVEWRNFGKGVELGKLAREGKAGLVLYKVAADAPLVPHVCTGADEMSERTPEFVNGAVD